MKRVDDFTPLLRDALADVEAAGLPEVASEARARCFAAYTTSTEWLGEVGLALQGLLQDHRGALPPATCEKIRRCLDEVAKVWPKFRARRLR